MGNGVSLMAYQKNTNDSRNIFCCGIVQQGVAAKTITKTEQVIEWTRICAATFDRYLGTDHTFKKQAALAIVHGHINGCATYNDLMGDNNNPGIHIRMQHEIDVFKDDPELYEFYKKMFHLKKGELQNDK